MQNKTKTKINYIITAAFIAALYAGLTYLSNAFGLAYGPIQLRISEILTILPVFTPAAIPGLTVGCFIANIGSFNVCDMIFGTVATLCAALLTYLFKNIKLKGIPFLAFFPPVIVNALVIGLEIELFFLTPDVFSLWGFVIAGLEVGLGQLIVCYAFGIPFYIVCKKNRIFERSFMIR